MLHYKVKARGFGKRWEKNTLDDAKVFARKLMIAYRVDDIFIDEYFNGEPTGTWYRLDEKFEFVPNVLQAA